MRQTTPQLVIDAHAIIGESPVWSADENALYWADIKGQALHRTDHATGETRSWRVPSDLGGYALMPGGGGAVVALRTGIFMLDLGDGRLEGIVRLFRLVGKGAVGVRSRREFGRVVRP